MNGAHKREKHKSYMKLMCFKMHTRIIMICISFTLVKLCTLYGKLYFSLKQNMRSLGKLPESLNMRKVSYLHIPRR